MRPCGCVCVGILILILMFRAKNYARKGRVVEVRKLQLEWDLNTTVTAIQSHSISVNSGRSVVTPAPSTLLHIFYGQLDFSSEPGVANEILENEPKSKVKLF